MASDRKLCVVCSKYFRSDLTTCPDDGNMLVLEAGDGTRASRLGHVIGNYRLLRVLGEGGVGTVYEAEHVRLGRRVALKLLHPEVVDTEVVTRFFNEARAVNEIRHANIIEVEDFVTTPTGEHYMLMELLKGEDLRSVMGREGRLEPARVSTIGQQIASALSAVHAVHIVHRDLKPDNVFVIQRDGKEMSKLLDFGVAKFTADGTGLTRDGMTMGTPQYMAPEQIITGEQVGTASDIYALGILMYELLTGVTPFSGASIAAILRAHVSEAVVPPSMRRGEPLPAVLEAAVMKCLEKEVKDRFATADELAEALRADEPVELTARAATPSARASQSMRAASQPGRAASEPRPASQPERRPRRVRQMLPAFAMAAAAAVIHFWPHSEPTTANAANVPVTVPANPAGPGPTNREAAEPSNHAAAEPTPRAAPEPQPDRGEPGTGAPAPTEIILWLESKPAGAEMFLGAKALGSTPVHIRIPVSSESITLTAKFADGREVRETIVPDSPRPPVVFERPAPSRPTTAKKPTTTTKPTKPMGQDRDATLDPFK